jgi:LmbE family N-acetylglucosaminyl deacetylase
MIELARQFTSTVKIRQTLRPARHVYDPFVIFDATHYLHRFHFDHLRAAQGMNDVIGAQQLLDRFAEIWEASAPAISADKTGL